MATIFSMQGIILFSNVCKPKVNPTPFDISVTLFGVSSFCFIYEKADSADLIFDSMVLAKKNGPPASKKGGKNKGQGMKTGKNFVRGNKGPRPLMSLRPGPGLRGPPGFMRPGPYGPPPGPSGPFFPPHPMMCPPGGLPGMFPPHGPVPQIWGGPIGPMGPPPPFRGPMGPAGPPGPMGPMRRGPTPLMPPQGLRPSSGPSGPRRGGPGPIRKPIGKNPINRSSKKPDQKIDFTEDTIDIQSNKLGTAF